MSILSIYCIGTGHNRNEPQNILSRLFNDSPSRPLSDGEYKASIPLQSSTNLKIIIDGPGSKDHTTGKGGMKSPLTPSGMAGNFWGDGVAGHTDLLLSLVMRLRPTPTDVLLVGHSRGAVLCLRVASYLNTAYPGVRTHLWLIDPVRRGRLGGGGDEVNKTLHGNVGNCRIVVMEDEGVGLYGPNLPAGAGSQRYIRMPGSHGTATQVCDASPIGTVTYQIARRDIADWHMPVAAVEPLWTDDEIMNEYFRVQLVNPIKWVKRVGSKTPLRVKRRVYDGGKVKSVQNTERGKFFDKQGLTNTYRGHPFFVNDHHHALCDQAFPTLSRWVVDKVGKVGGKAGMTGAKPIDAGTLADAARLSSRCPHGFDLFCKLFGAAGNS